MRKLEYKLVRCDEDSLTELRIDGFVVAIFTDSGIFERIRFVDVAGVQVDGEGRIIEEISADSAFPTILRR